MAKGRYDIEKELKKWLSGAKKVVVAGIGNPIRMDDFVGVKIVQGLNGKVSDRVLLIECETVPEGYMKQITDFNPTHVLLIDAAVLGLKPGEARLTDPKKLMSFSAFSTHLLPLRMFCDYVEATAKARIGLLLIEPEKTDFGEGLTPKMMAAAEKITEVLQRTLH